MTSSEADMGRLAQRYRAELAEAFKEAATQAVAASKAAAKAKVKTDRAERARSGWFNWYVDRGRLPLNPTKREMRAVSWRRVL